MKTLLLVRFVFCISNNDNNFTIPSPVFTCHLQRLVKWYTNIKTCQGLPTKHAHATHITSIDVSSHHMAIAFERTTTQMVCLG